MSIADAEPTAVIRTWMTMIGVAVAAAAPVATEVPGAAVSLVAAGLAAAFDSYIGLRYPSPVHGGYLTVLDTYLRIQWGETGPIVGQIG